jgi:hypothetical protein
VAGTDSTTFTVNQDGAAGTDQDPALILEGGDGGTELISTLLWQDSSADKVYLWSSTTVTGTFDRSPDFTVGAFGDATATTIEADPALRFKGHTNGDAVGTFKTASIVLDSSAGDLRITAPTVISVVTNVNAEAGLDVTGAAFTVTSQTMTMSLGISTFDLDTTSGNVDIDLTTGAFTVDTTTTGGISLDSQAASNFSTTAAALTLSTITSGTLAVTSAGALTMTGAAASTWSLSAGALTVQTATAAALNVNSGTGANASNALNLQTASTTRMSVDDDSVNFVVAPMASSDNGVALGSTTVRWTAAYLYEGDIIRAVTSNNATAPTTGNVVAIATDGTLAQADADTDNSLARAVGIYGGVAGMYRPAGSVIAVTKRQLHNGSGGGARYEAWTPGDVIFLTSSGHTYSDEDGANAPTAAAKKGSASKATSPTAGDVIYEMGVVVATSSNATATGSIAVLPRFVSVN